MGSLLQIGSLLHVLPWVLGSVGVGVGIGFYLGSTASPKNTKQEKKKEAATLRVLTSVLDAAEQLNLDVGTHNTEIQNVGETLTRLELEGALREAQLAVLGEIESAVEANQQLEEDLTYARLRIEEQAAELDRTRREARTDTLSGVPNRKGLDEKLMMMLADWKRKGRPFVIALADVDHFKWINDTHGHQAGDEVVSQVGEFLRDKLRGDDFVARYGGDEFAILFTDVELESGAIVAERIRESVTKHNFGLQVGSEEAVVTFSIGVASPWPGATVEELMAHADAALYRAKEAGRNQVYLYDHPDGSLVAVTTAVG